MNPRFFEKKERERFQQLYALRAQLEGFAARTAAARVAAGARTGKLERRLQEMRVAARQEDYAAFVKADMGFHRAIAELADVPSLVAMWDLMEKNLRDFVGWGHRDLFRNLESLVEQHRAILAAIRTGQPKAAERVIQLSLDPIWQLLAYQTNDRSGRSGSVERVRGYILLHLYERLSVGKLAREVAHVSPSHLAREFRRIHGESIGTFIRRLRLGRGASLLRETDIPIREIADRVGYHDPSRFAAHFSRQFQCSPRNWRLTGKSVSLRRKNGSA